MDYNKIKVIRSKRKTIQIIVDREGGVTVRAPLRSTNSEINRFIQEKESWINKSLASMEQKRSLRPKHFYREGDNFLYRGDIYTLRIVIAKGVGRKLSISDNSIIVLTDCDNEEIVSELINNWYVNQALIVFKERVEAYIGYVGRPVRRITIREQKTRWGSCSSKGNLNFNWKLIKAPKEVLDYVVVHELCHLIHMNHSEEFWNLVGKIMPEYKQCRQWLKNNGEKLN